MGSGIMNAPAGKFWKERPNKGLDRPRLEGVDIKTTVTSVGCPGGSSGDEKRMMFSSIDPMYLWGRQKKTYVQQAPREDKSTKKMPKPDKVKE